VAHHYFDDLVKTSKVLLQSGLSILDVNVIRKRLEQGKGGRLAAAAGPTASLVTLVLSDVIGDPLDLISSGPTVPDTSSWTDAWQIVQQNDFLKANLPSSVMKVLELGNNGMYNDKTHDCLINSPPTNHPIFQNGRSRYCLVGNNRAAVYAAADIANSLGYQPFVLGTQWQGEASTVATILISMVEHIISDTCEDPYSILRGSFSMDNIRKSIALIVGGETTVTIPSSCKGVGGRNQELALVAGIQLNKLSKTLDQSKSVHVVLASIGTDGTDGPTDAAGAIINSGTISRLDAIPSISMTSNEAVQDHDSYNYLKNIDPIEYGGTGMTVLDKVRK
jgi:glycerate 2-kinase